MAILWETQVKSWSKVGPSELEIVLGIQEVTLSHVHTVHAFLQGPWPSRGPILAQNEMLDATSGCQAQDSVVVLPQPHAFKASSPLQSCKQQEAAAAAEALSSSVGETLLVPTQASRSSCLL